MINWKTNIAGIILVTFAGFLYYLHCKSHSSDILATAGVAAVSGIGLLTAKDNTNRN